jgi:adenine-specific DNA-methyltransferase
MAKLAAAGRLRPVGNSLMFKRYLDDFPFMPLTNQWDDAKITGFTETRYYVVQTPSRAIERCILMTTDPGDLVLDPTCGSGTTAYVAEQWGRRWITIDTSRVALALARQRLMTASYSMYRTTDDGNDPGRNLVYRTVPHVTLRSIAQNPRLDPDKVKGKTKAEIDAIIAAGADQETLYDQPEVVRNVTRVSGPFTVEAIPAPILSPEEFTPIGAAPETLVDEGEADGGATAQNAGASIANLVTLLRQDGVTFPGGKKMMVPDIVTRSGQFLHAEATTETKGQTQRVAFSFGPQYGPVTVQQVEQGLRQANRAGFDVLVFCGFAFEGAAIAAIEAPQPEREVQVAWAHIRPDLLTTDEHGNRLLKTTASSQLFTAFGEPDASLEPSDEGWAVSINGVDIYEPVSGAVTSSPIEKVAAWFLDTDYDGRTFCICQAFFPQTTAWDKLARALKGTIDLEKLEKYKGHVSLPFQPGKHRAVAVKVIDLRGNEVMRVLRFPEEQA